VEVLEAAGQVVDVVHPACCGRPLISQGLLAEARKQAEIVVTALYPVARRGERILFCEPSCLSAIKEDAPSLLRGALQEKARLVAEACTTFEDYARRLDLSLRPVEGRILVHGHCHQKSMGLLAPTIELLKHIPSAGVVDLDAGCCGMAGSFGYTHYEVSRAIAERRLMPAVRAMPPGDVLVAAGTSCRHQVFDFSKQTQVLHPAMLIRGLLT
jgi:Fe-S oxidoreductase